MKLLTSTPATVPTIARAHSSIKFSKNDLCSTMSDDCMNAVMLLHINKDLALNYDQAIDNFARKIPEKGY